MAYVRPYTRKDGTRVKGHYRQTSGGSASASVPAGGTGLGSAIFGTAVVSVAGYLAWGALTGGASASAMTAQSLRVASTRVTIASATLTFSAAEPKVTDLGDTAQIDYSVTIKNQAGRAVTWDATKQRLELQASKSASAAPGKVRVAAHHTQQVNMSFEVDEDEKPLALHLQLGGKQVTVKLNADLSTPVERASSTPPKK